MCDLADSAANREWPVLYRRVTVAKLLQHLPTKLLDLRGARAGQDQAVQNE